MKGYFIISRNLWVLTLAAAQAVGFAAGCSKIAADQKRGIGINKQTLYKYNRNLPDTEYTVPEGITTIGSQAFAAVKASGE